MGSVVVSEIVGGRDGRTAEAPVHVVYPATGPIPGGKDQEVPESLVVVLVVVEVVHWRGISQVLGNRKTAITVRFAPRVDFILRGRVGGVVTHPLLRIGGEQTVRLRRLRSSRMIPAAATDND